MPKRKCSEIDKSVGQRLREYRRLCGLTQDQVASVLNINRTTYTKYETGVSEPSYELLKKIVALFGTDFNTILGGRDLFQSAVAEPKSPLNCLTAQERDIISFYRTFSKEEKAKVNDKINEICAEQAKRFIKKR